MTRTGQKACVVLFFCALLIVGIAAEHYGLPQDEPAERVILEENMLEYATRLSGAQSDAARYYGSLGRQRISVSIERDHGLSAYYPFVPLMTLYRGDPERVMVLWHLYTWCLFMVGVVSLYSLLRSLRAARTAACLGSLLLYLSPRFFAEGHYNNKDVVLLSFALFTLAAGARLIARPGMLRALAFSLAGAVAANTKVIGALPWGLAGVAMLLTLAARRELTAKNVRAGLVAVGSFAVFYTALTPAMWGDPAAFLQYLVTNATAFTRWQGLVLFDGTLYDQTGGLPLPRRYVPVMILLTTPLPYLLLAAVGQAYAAVRIVRRDPRWALLVCLTLVWLAPVGYAVLARPILYNGWRHLYIAYAGIAAMGGLGISALTSLTARRKALQRVSVALIAAAFAFQAVGIALNHPYQYAYYNALVRGDETRYELDYWNVSARDALQALLRAEWHAGDAPLSVSATDPMSMSGLIQSRRVLPEAQRGLLTPVETQDCAYLLCNQSYAALYRAAVPTGYQPLLSITGYGRTICTVYKRQVKQGD